MTTWTKLRNGEWGVKGPEREIRAGATVTVTRKDGTQSRVYIRRVLWHGGGVALAAVGRVDGRRCITGGNCSSFGSGRHCGGEDCDGYY